MTPLPTWTDRYTRALMPTYGTPRRILVRGQGAHVWDAEGRRYLDLLAGIATTSLGHAHPDLVAAVAEQAATLGHVSNFFATVPQVELAERLLHLLGADGRVFLCNSGTEANEAAYKLARRTGRPKLVAAHHSFHGRTIGALTLTGQPAKRAGFGPLPGGVEFVPYGDAQALAAEVDSDTAAVFLEPIQGEAGVVVPPAGYLAAAREITSRHGALLVLDEVQTGIGRTGAWFAHTAAGVLPDVVTVAKGLGGGFPVGACVALGAAAELLTAGSHGTTFGGNPLASAVALRVLDVIERDGLLAQVGAVGDRLRTGLLRAAGTDYPLLSGVRGAGLLLGCQLTAPVAAAFAAQALTAGFIVNEVGADTVRLAPPLVLTAEQADSFVAALPELLAAVASQTSDAPEEEPSGKEPPCPSRPLS